jgi:large subunit ribosomal protein L10
MKPKSKKQDEVNRLREALGKSRTVFAASFQGIKVTEDFELRRAVRGAGGSYQVVANRLARVASEGTPAEPLMKNLKGMTSLVFADKDPVALAKALTAYAKNHPVFAFRAGIVEGKAVNASQIAELANLPGKEQIYAKLLFLVNSSAQRLAAVIGAVGRNVAVVVDQGVKEKKFKD